MWRYCVLAVLILVGIVCNAVRGEEKSSIGKKIDSFKLQDFRGAAHELAGLKDRELVVVAFLGTECPLAKLYGPRLAELAKQYEPRLVAFVAIDANQQDTLAEMAQYARVSKIEFPFLKDPANAGGAMYVDDASLGAVCHLANHFLLSTSLPLPDRKPSRSTAT